MRKRWNPPQRWEIYKGIHFGWHIDPPFDAESTYFHIPILSHFRGRPRGLRRRRQTMTDPFEAVAQAIRHENFARGAGLPHTEWDPDAAHEKYLRMAQAAIDSLGLTTERGISYRGPVQILNAVQEFSDYGPAWVRHTRLVSPWTRSETANV